MFFVLTQAFLEAKLSPNLSFASDVLWNRCQYIVVQTRCMSQLIWEIIRRLGNLRDGPDQYLTERHIAAESGPDDVTLVTFATHSDVTGDWRQVTNL